MIRHLADTNVVSELARPRPDAKVVRWFAEQDGFLLSAVSVEEISFGAHRAPKERRAKLEPWLDALMATYEVVPVTSEIARLAGALRAAREAAGRRVTASDMLIAASALTHRLTLVTRNVDDFDGCGVEIENPFD